MRASKRVEDRDSTRGHLERAIEKGLSSRKAKGNGVTKGKGRMGCGVRRRKVVYFPVRVLCKVLV